MQKTEQKECQNKRLSRHRKTSAHNVYYILNFVRPTNTVMNTFQLKKYKRYQHTLLVFF